MENFEIRTWPTGLIHNKWKRTHVADWQYAQ